jgi:hypothetical protein
MSETPRTASQLVDELETCAFDCGDYSNSVTASQARIAKREAALRKAGKDVVERITTLERELAAMTAAKELAERQVDALCRVLVAAALLPDETSSGLQPVQVWRNWSRAEAEGGKG